MILGCLLSQIIRVNGEKSVLCICCTPVIYNYEALVFDKNCILKIGLRPIHNPDFIRLHLSVD